MTPRTLARTLWSVSIGCVLVRIPVDIAIAATPNDWGEYVFSVAAVGLYATVGMLITSRQLGNRVGLLFSCVALSAGVGLLAGSYAELAGQRGLPFVAGAAWIAHLAFITMLGPLAFLVLIFPTGSPPSRWWRWVGGVMLAAYAIAIVLFAVTPGPMEAGFAEREGIVPNPLAVPASWERAIETLTVVPGTVVFLGAMLSIVSLIQRYRHAAESERQQIRWLALLAAVIGGVLAVVLPLEAIGIAPTWVANASFLVLISLIFLGVPITCAIAILRYGLWDLDVVVKKTVQYGVLVVATIATVALVLVLLPVLFVGIDRDILPGVIIGLLLGGVIAVLRVPARRLANRLVYGRRATPYEVLSEFAGRVGETYSTEDVLPRMAQLLGEATGARAATVWLRVGNVMRAEASWPTDAPDEGDVPAAHDALPPLGGDRAFEVRHRGELLGALTVTEAADDPVTPAKEKLARDMAAQAGLVLRNVRLIEDLRDSRHRIVAAQDERAKKLERNIHDGAQQQLVALTVKARLARQLAGVDPAKTEEMLTQIEQDTQHALEELRDLARGIYPPLLADKGLQAALAAQARKVPVPTRVEADGVGRFPPEVEAAIYFCALEALQNVSKYAQASRVEVSVGQDDGLVTFTVADDGRGFDPGATSMGTGVQGMADRIEAVGGTLQIESGPGVGTTVKGRIPTTATSGAG
jgi:signal transduction histidine kinase